MSRPRRGMGPGRPTCSFPPKRRQPSFEKWPALDRAAWLAGIALGDPLSKPAPGAHLAKVTQRSYWQTWARFISYLAATGQLIATESPAERLTRARAGAFFTSLRDQVGASTLQSIGVRLSYAMDVLAPGCDWGWVRRHPVLPTASEVRDSRKPINPPDPVLLLGRALKHAASAASIADPVQAALVCRNGTLMAFAVVTALRRKNLAELRLGIHLLVEADRFRLAIHHSMKNQTVLDVPLPALLVPCFQSWLFHHRPYLLRDRVASDAVWLEKNGEPLTYEALPRIFEQTGVKLIGRPVTPHHLRHALATEIMEESPRNFAVASAALAHKGTSSVNRTYDRSGDQAANTILQETIRNRLRDAHEQCLLNESALDGELNWPGSR